MTVASNVARARVGALRVMLDTCEITRPSDPDLATLDEATGVLVPAAPPSTVYTGACAIKATGVADRTEGGQSVDVEGFTLLLPNTAAAPMVGDLVEITASTLSPSLVGMVPFPEVVDLLTDDTLGVFRILNLQRLVPGEPEP